MNAISIYKYSGNFSITAGRKYYETKTSINLGRILQRHMNNKWYYLTYILFFMEHYVYLNDCVYYIRLLMYYVGTNNYYYTNVNRFNLKISKNIIFLRKNALYFYTSRIKSKILCKTEWEVWYCYVQKCRIYLWNDVTSYGYPYLSCIISLNVLLLFRNPSSNLSVSNFFTSTNRSIMCSCCFLLLLFQLSKSCEQT